MVTGALVLTGISPGVAAEEVTVADDIRSATSSQATNATFIESEVASEVEVKGGVVSAGTGSGNDIEMQLPGIPLATEENQDLLLNVTGEDTYTIAVQDTGSGTFRALVHIESAAAPKEYRFDLGTDVEIVPLEDGRTAVRDLEGDLLGSVEPAWAVDAIGKAVPSSYRVEGSALVQTVAFTGYTAFPFVADPFWFLPCSSWPGSPPTQHPGPRRPRCQPSAYQAGSPERREVRRQQGDLGLHAGHW